MITVETVLLEVGENLTTVTLDQSLIDAARALAAIGGHAAIVLDKDQKIVGTITPEAIIRAIAKLGADALAQSIESFVTQTTLTCRPTDSVDMALATMIANHLTYLPVIHERDLIGLVFVGDLIRFSGGAPAAHGSPPTNSSERGGRERKRPVRSADQADQIQPLKDELLDCSVFAPGKVRPGQRFLLQAFLHLPDQAELVVGLAASAAGHVERQVTRSLDTPISRNTPVAAYLDPDGLILESNETASPMTWRGTPVGEQFVLRVPRFFYRRSYFPILRLFSEDAIIGRVSLKITASRGWSETAEIQKGHFERYRRAFLSYASQDRAEVLKRAQTLRAAKIDIFQDILSLDPGARWQRELYDHIDDADLFLLFWSKSAADSKWVMKEVKHALLRQKRSRRGKPDFVPVILDGPPPVRPPKWLSHIHFDDPICYVLSATSDKKSERLVQS